MSLAEISRQLADIQALLPAVRSAVTTRRVSIELDRRGPHKEAAERLADLDESGQPAPAQPEKAPARDRATGNAGLAAALRALKDASDDDEEAEERTLSERFADVDPKAWVRYLAGYDLEEVGDRSSVLSAIAEARNRRRASYARELLRIEAALAPTVRAAWDAHWTAQRAQRHEVLEGVSARREAFERRHPNLARELIVALIGTKPGERVARSTMAAFRPVFSDYQTRVQGMEEQLKRTDSARDTRSKS